MGFFDRPDTSYFLSSHIQLSPKGIELFEKIDALLREHTKNMRHNGLMEQEIKTVKGLLQRLEAFWNFVSTHDGRPLL